MYRAQEVPVKLAEPSRADLNDGKVNELQAGCQKAGEVFTPAAQMKESTLFVRSSTPQPITRIAQLPEVQASGQNVLLERGSSPKALATEADHLKQERASKCFNEDLTAIFLSDGLST